MDWFPAVRLVISLYPYMDTCAESISVTKKGLAYKRVRTIILSIVFVMLAPPSYLRCEEGGSDVRAASEEVMKGDALYGQTRLQDSLAHYKRALIIKPSADVYFKIGMVYMNLSKPLLAEEFFLQAIGLNNEYAPAYKALGEIYVERSEAGQAREAFVKAQSLFSKAGDMSEAILCKRCEKAVDYIVTADKLQLETSEEKKELLKVSQADAYKRFIETLFQKSQDIGMEPQKILYYYELVAEQTYFKYPQALCKLGTALTECGRYEEAIKKFKAALSLRPEYRDARYFLALAYEKDGYYKKAEATLMEVVVTDPRWPYAYKEFARCYMSKGRFGTSAGENFYKAGLLFLEEKDLLSPVGKERSIEEATICLKEIGHLSQGKSSVLYKGLKRKIDQEKLCKIGS